MADISTYINAFKNAVYGEDVRDALIGLANALNQSATDSETAVTGAFIKKDTVISSSTDLNDIIEPGAYQIRAGSDYKPLNVPSDAQGVLLVFPSGLAYKAQAFITASLLFIRFYNVGGWQSWVEIGDNSDTEQIINAVSDDVTNLQNIMEQFSTITPNTNNNLFNKNGSLITGALNNNGTILTNGSYANYRTTNYIALNPNNTYQVAVLNKSTSTNYDGTYGRRYVLIFGDNKNDIIGYQNGYNVYTISGAKYIRVSVHYEVLSSGSSYGPVIQLGSSLQPYQEYNGGVHINKSLITVAQDAGYDNTLPISQAAVTKNFVAKNVEGKNKFNPLDSEDGYLFDNTGKVTVYQSYKTTGYIDVSNFEHNICVTGRTRTHLQYDINKNPIASTYVRELATNPIIDKNSNAYFIRLSYYSEDESTYQVEDNTTQTSYEPYACFAENGINFLNDVTTSGIENMLGGSSSDVLHGKKWWACGDSFTEWTTESYTPSEAPNVTGLRYFKTYPYWIGKRTGMTVYNFAKSGQTIAMPASPGTFTNAFSNGLYQQIPSDVDYITLKFGINDSHHAPGSSGGDGEDNTGVIPIGDVSDTGTSTFCGAYNTVLAYLIENHPNAKIGILVSNGCDTDEYRQKAILIAQKWGLPYLDENGSDRCPALIRSSNPNVSSTLKELRKTMWASTSTNTHPNVSAHEFESTIVEAFLRSL